MTDIWPKRDKDGRHIGAMYDNELDLTRAEVKPLSELLEKLEPDVVEQARADAEKELGTARCKKCYDCGYTISAELYANQCDCGAHELP